MVELDSPTLDKVKLEWSEDCQVLNVRCQQITKLYKISLVYGGRCAI